MKLFNDPTIILPSWTSKNTKTLIHKDLTMFIGIIHTDQDLETTQLGNSRGMDSELEEDNAKMKEKKSSVTTWIVKRVRKKKTNNR